MSTPQMLAVHPYPAGTVLADPSTTGLSHWMQSNVVGVILLVIAMAILMAAFAGRASKVMMVGGLTLVGLFFLGIAVTSGSYQGISSWLMHMAGA